jgi:hypothetical protein
MMQSEWMKLTGNNPTDFEWDVIHTVYQYHPAIPETGGKEKLAQLFALGGFGLISDMSRGAKEYEQKGDEESSLLCQIRDLSSRLDMVRLEMATHEKDIRRGTGRTGCREGDRLRRTTREGGRHRPAAWRKSTCEQLHRYHRS